MVAQILAEQLRFLFQSVLNQGALPEHILDLRIGLEPDGAHETGDGDLTVLVDTHPEHVRAIRLVFQPSTTIRDDGGGIGDVSSLVRFHVIIHTRASDDLGDDDTLCAVDNEGSALGHQGEVAHEDLLFLDLVRLLVAQAHLHLDGSGIGGVSGLAGFYVILGALLHGEVNKGQLQVASIVGNTANILKNLTQAGFQKPSVRFFLNVQQSGHLSDFLLSGKALSQGVAEIHIFDH